MTEVTIDELKQARYMSLTSPPASPEAKRLVSSIIDIILNALQRLKNDFEAIFLLHTSYTLFCLN
ncbi:hypothetical protein AB8878_06035 [Alphaproteobacteria bacterium LSUCC0226]